MADPILAILLIEGDDRQAAHLRDILTATDDSLTGFQLQLHRESGMQGGLARLTQQTPDVVLVNLSLPDSQGANTWSRVQQAAPTIPVILLCDPVTESIAVEALQNGAYDYCSIKELTPHTLARSLRLAMTYRAMATELQTSENRYRALSETVQDIIFITDAQGVIQFVNLHGASLCGSTPEELRGKSAMRFLPAATESEQRELLQRVFQQQETISQEGRAEFPGNSLWIHTRLVPIVNSLGQIETAIGVARDITERREAEEEIQRRSYELAVINDVIAAGASTFNIRTILETTLERLAQELDIALAGATLLQEGNETVEIVTSYPSLQNSPLAGIILPLGDDEDGFIRRIIRERQVIIDHDVMNRSEVEPLQQIFRQYQMSSLMILPLLVQNKVMGGLQLATQERHDFTPDEISLAQNVAAAVAQAVHNAQLYVKAQALVQQTQSQSRQLQEIVDTLHQGIILLDGDHQVVLTNAAGQAQLDLIGELDESGHLLALSDVSIDRLLLPLPVGKLHHEVFVQEPQKRIFEALAHSITRGQEDIGWVIVLNDVSEERAFEERLQAQDRLTAVGQLAAGIAHDFNNILSIIRLHTELLQRSTFPEAQTHRRLAIVYEQTEHAAALVRQILDFSRRSVMERVTVDMLPFIQDIIALWKRTLPENIAIVFSCEEDGTYQTVADPTRLQQVLMNLAVNARDAMSLGGELRLALSLITLDANQSSRIQDMRPGKWLALSIEDSGNGIEAEHLNHLFEPFFTTKSVGNGVGLGLGQVYGIIRQHGGHIQVESEVGHGTKFTIYLPPIEDERNPYVSAKQLTQNQWPTVSPSTRTTTLLVVEDNLATQMAIQEVLESYGYNTHVAANGADALKLYGQHSDTIDLILSDLMMPGIDGVALYQQITAEYPDAKMLIMTGYPLDNEGHFFLEEGVAGWIQKPFSQGSLMEKVQEMLSSESD